MKIAHPSSERHYEWLDLLRFSAAMMVVLCHVRGSMFSAYGSLAPQSRSLVTATFFAFTRLGLESVIAFFVLSGYLVGGKAIERMLHGSFDPTSYAVDRLSRIWIPLIPALAWTSIVSYYIFRKTDGPFIWVGNLLGLQNVAVSAIGHNDPLWSLAYEIWFYIIVYAVGRLGVCRS